MPKLLTHLFMCATVGVVTIDVHADVIGFTDFEEWEQAVGFYNTIDFTGYAQGTLITDQYIDTGVVFTDGNDVIFHTDSFLKDGEGLHGGWSDKHITVFFIDTPQLWIGVDHSGYATIDLYTDSGSTLIGSFDNSKTGSGNFTGVVSSVPFDVARIHRKNSNTPAVIDDLHWGVPAPGAVAVLTLAALFGGSRGRGRVAD